MPAPSSHSSGSRLLVGESLLESSSSSAMSSSFKENNDNNNNSNAIAVEVAIGSSSSFSNSRNVLTIKSTTALSSHAMDDDANNNPPLRRRVLLPSLGGGRLVDSNQSNNQSLLGAASSGATSISSATPSFQNLRFGGTLSASHQNEPQQQQQHPQQEQEKQPTTNTTTRRESLDETAITNHTHSSASHFSSSTSGSLSTFTTTSTSTASSVGTVVDGSHPCSNNNNDTKSGAITSSSSSSSRMFRPLSSTSRIGGSNYDYNNLALAITTTSSNAATSGGTTATNSNHNDGENIATSLSSSSTLPYGKSSSSSSASTERVLRYGETVDSLFCFLDDEILSREEAKEEKKEVAMDQNKIPQSYHWNLCREICLGSKKNDAFAWVEALELSLDKAAAGGVARNHSIGGAEIEGKGEKPDVGKRLIQLHRRATSRFKLSTEKDTIHHRPVLQLWLLYSLVLLKYGSNNSHNHNDDECKSINDARQTLKHVQRLYFCTCGKEFYNALVMAVNQQQREEEEEDEGRIGEHDIVEKNSVCDEDTGADAVIASWQQCLGHGGSIVNIVKDQMTRLEKVRLLEGKPENVSHISKSSSTADAEGVESIGFSVSKAANMAVVKAVAPMRLLSLPHLNPKKEEKRSFLTNEAGHEPPSAHDVPENPLLEPTKRLLSTNIHSSSSVNNGDCVGVDRIGSSSSFRAKIASRKKLKTADRLTPYRTRKSTREARGGGGGGLRAILSETMEEGNESDDSSHDADISYITAKRSAESCASSTVVAKGSAGSFRSTASSSKDVSLFYDNISPIDPECTTSVKDMDLDYLLNWDPTKRDTSSIKRATIAGDTLKEKVVKKAAVSVPKITRNDLGYMMDWNPFDKLEKKSEDLGSSGCSSNGEPSMVVHRTTSQGSNAGNNMSTIDEATEVSASLNQGKNIGAMSQSQTLGSNRDDMEKKNINGLVVVGTNVDSSDNNPFRNDEDEKSLSTSQENMISISGFERSFLPLIQNKNIIHVENEPYAKLGVIGKGGSCKVYRALSRDCDVVALKKVKIDGLNKAAIDGYANEIALLKRLKGNPAIIQLYSAEVDLERKSILLVMELGEVDLNFVLRQQELLASTQPGRGAGRSSLNMNFIRLTWQQMLTAVHSIHEERIIHSDLKPANFLFVRGALKLIDFGIAKAIEKEDTTNIYRETLSGTLSYMSPEAIMDTSTNAKGIRVNKCGRPSDIWSLGCILYQMVYGKTPFADCQGIPQKVLAITNVNHEIRFPDGVDESAISAMKLCLQRNPKLRPPIIGANGLLNDHCFLHGRKKV